MVTGDGNSGRFGSGEDGSSLAFGEGLTSTGGAAVEMDDTDPDPDAFDCSELVKWAASSSTDTQIGDTIESGGFDTDVVAVVADVRTDLESNVDGGLF